MLVKWAPRIEISCWRKIRFVNNLICPICMYVYLQSSYQRNKTCMNTSPCITVASGRKSSFAWVNLWPVTLACQEFLAIILLSRMNTDDTWNPRVTVNFFDIHVQHGWFVSFLCVVEFQEITQAFATHTGWVTIKSYRHHKEMYMVCYWTHWPLPTSIEEIAV